MITFKFVRFTLVVYVSRTVNVLVTDIILKSTSQEHLISTLIHIVSRLFELFSKEVRVKKQPGMPLNCWKCICQSIVRWWVCRIKSFIFQIDWVQTFLGSRFYWLDSISHVALSYNTQKHLIRGAVKMMLVRRKGKRSDAAVWQTLL